MANINKSYLLLAALLAAKTGTAEAVFPSSQCAQIVDCFNQYTEDDNDEADTACCTDSWGVQVWYDKLLCLSPCRYVGAG